MYDKIAISAGSILPKLKLDPTSGGFGKSVLNKAKTNPTLATGIRRTSIREQALGDVGKALSGLKVSSLQTGLEPLMKIAIAMGNPKMPLPQHAAMSPNPPKPTAIQLHGIRTDLANDIHNSDMRQYGAPISGMEAAAERMHGQGAPHAQVVQHLEQLAGVPRQPLALPPAARKPNFLGKLKWPLAGLGAYGLYKFLTAPSPHQEYMQQTQGYQPMPAAY